MTGRPTDNCVMDVAMLLPSRRSVRRRARLAGRAALSLSMIVSLLVVTGRPATAATGHRPTPQRIHNVGPGKPVRPHPVKRRNLPPWHATRTTWPPAATATIDLSTAAATTPALTRIPDATPTTTTRVGSLPITLAAVGKPTVKRVAVTVADHDAAVAAGVNGVLVSAVATDIAAGSGPVTVSVDYSSFADAFGGDYAQRLHLVSLPACALTTPARLACRRQTPLRTTVNSAASTLTARVTIPARQADSRHADGGTTSAPASTLSGGVVLAATSAPSGSAGDYTATSLKPSGTWTAGNNSGDFNYSYPINVPPVAGSLLPDVTLAYDSQSVDGEQVSTNNQSSWIGDGWD